MKDKELFSISAFTKAIDIIADNLRFLSWLNLTFRIKWYDEKWIQYDIGIKLKDIEQGRGFIPYNMTNEMLRWFYEAYATEERMDRESRDFVSLDAHIATSNVIITKPRKRRHAAVDPVVAAIIDDLDWTAIKPRQIRYATGSVEKDILREQVRHFHDVRTALFPFDRYEDTLDKDSVNRLAELMVQLPGDLYAKALSLSQSDIATLAPLFIYSPIEPDGTRKRNQLTHAKIANSLGISRPAMKKRLDKIYKHLYGRDRGRDKKVRAEINRRREQAEKTMYASIEATFEEKVEKIETMLADQMWHVFQCDG